MSNFLLRIENDGFRVESNLKKIRLGHVKIKEILFNESFDALILKVFDDKGKEHNLVLNLVDLYVDADMRNINKGKISLSFVMKYQGKTDVIEMKVSSLEEARGIIYEIVEKIEMIGKREKGSLPFYKFSPQVESLLEDGGVNVNDGIFGLTKRRYILAFFFLVLSVFSYYLLNNGYYFSETFSSDTQYSTLMEKVDNTIKDIGVYK